MIKNTRNGGSITRNSRTPQFQTRPQSLRRLLPHYYLTPTECTKLEQQQSETAYWHLNSRPLLEQVHSDVSQGSAVEVGATAVDHPFGITICSSIP
jgi:hypothetical protein